MIQVYGKRFRLVGGLDLLLAFLGLVMVAWASAQCLPPPPTAPGNAGLPYVDGSGAWYSGCGAFDPATGGSTLGRSGSGSGCGDPVNLQTGAETYSHGPDLVVYNPNGHPAMFQRTWGPSGDFGVYAWYHNFQIYKESVQKPNSPLEVYLVYPNGSRELLASNGVPPADMAKRPYVYVNGTIKWKADGTVWAFGSPSGSKSWIESITPLRGDSLDFIWSGSQLTNVYSGGAHLLQIAYSAGGDITSVTDTQASRRVYYTGETVVSQIVPATSGSGPARYTFGYADGKMTSITVPSPTGTGTSTTTIIYDSATNKVQSLSDANGHVTQFTYNTGSTLVEQKTALGGLMAKYTAKYNADGYNTGIIDAAGKSTTIAYTDTNYPYLPTSVTYRDGLTETTEYDSEGRVSTHTDTRGIVTTYTWSTVNDIHQLESIQEAGRSPINFSYTNNLLTSVTVPSPTGTGQEIYQMFYDVDGNIMSMSGPSDNGGTQTTTYEYETDGAYTQSKMFRRPIVVYDNLAHGTHLRYDVSGRVVSVRDTVGYQYDATYNIAGQLLTVEAPATGQSGAGRSRTEHQYLYTGGPSNLSKLFNESNSLIRTISRVYGAEGELLSVSGATEPVTYTYDAAYRLKTMKDGNNNTTTYNYNWRGFLTSVVMPGSETITYNSYDFEGRVLQLTDAKGIVTNYVYNGVGKSLSDIQYPATPSLNIHFNYDSYGRVTSRTDSTGSQSYTYNELDLLTNVTTTYTGLPAKSVSYTYWDGGARKTMSTPAGTTQYFYDDASRLTSMINPFSETSSWTYGLNNWLSTQTLGNGTVTTYLQNGLGQLTALYNTTSTATQLSSFHSMVHDGAGNLTSIIASIPGATSFEGTTTFTYDSKDQILSEVSARAGGYTNTFGYDAAGNPTTFKGTARAYNAKNQLTTGSYAYDLNGNPTTYNGTTLTFDANNQMTSFGGSTLTAGYLADGRRAWKQTASGRTYFLYDGMDIVCELDASGNVTATNTWGANGLVSRRVGSTSTFYTFDQRGTTVQRLDVNENVLSSHMTDAFGTLGSAPITTDPYDGFGAQWGYYTDHETGLQLLGFRYYDQANGRFVTRDPIGYTGGINLYIYAGNQPTNRIDPLGLKPKFVIIVGNIKDYDNQRIQADFTSLVGKLMDEYGDKYNVVIRFARNSDDVIRYLSYADAAALVGHGAPFATKGGPLLNDDLEAVAAKRKKLGKPNLKILRVYSCNALADEADREAYLGITDALFGFTDLCYPRHNAKDLDEAGHWFGKKRVRAPTGGRPGAFPLP